MKNKDKWIFDYIEEYKRVNKKEVDIIRHGSYYEIVSDNYFISGKFRKSDIVRFTENFKTRSSLQGGLLNVR